MLWYLTLLFTRIERLSLYYLMIKVFSFIKSSKIHIFTRICFANIFTVSFKPISIVLLKLRFPYTHQKYLKYFNTCAKTWNFNPQCRMLMITEWLILGKRKIMLEMNSEYQLSSLSLKVRPVNWALMQKAIITLWQKATSTKRQLEVKPSFMSRANFILIIKLILPRIMKRHTTSYNEIYLTLLIFIIWFCHILCW